MNKYKIRYYTSGGYRTTGSLVTNYIIKRDKDNQLSVFDGDVLIGGIVEIEELFLDQLGYRERIMIVDAIPC